MNLKLRNATLAVIAASALVISGCSSSDSGSSGEAIDVKLNGSYNPKDRSELKEGGELRLALDEISQQENPFQADGTRYTSDVWKYYNPQIGLFDGSGEFHPNNDYITDIKEEEKNGKTVITYTIHDKAQYNDGTPIDWKSFEHTWKYNNGEDKSLNVSSTEGYELIESVTKGKTDKQAVVTYKHAYPWWQGLFNFLLPPQVDSAEKFNKAYLGKLRPEWGAGPFKVDNVDFVGGTVSFVPNEKWWGDKPFLDKVTYRQMEDQASINAFKAGEIDATGVGNKDRLAAVKDMNDIEIRTAMMPSNSLIVLNSGNEMLKDIKVREAVLTGIDRSQLAAIRFNGLNGYKEELPGSLNLYQTQKGYEDNVGAVVKFDAEKAKSLLEEAGWKEGADGIREKSGKKLSLRYTLLGDSVISKAMATATQKMLKDIGIDLKVEERPSSDFSEIATKKDFDIFPMGFTAGDPFGIAYFGQVYRSDSELNKSGTGTPEMDKKIEELAKIADPDEQIKKGNELEREALSTYGIMPIYNGPAMVATSPKLANFGAASFAVLEVEDIGYTE